MADVALDPKKRQAAYAAKNRRKAKALRRPDARAVADAYMAAVEDTRLINLITRVDEHIALSFPDTTLSGLPPEVKEERAQAVIEFIRIFVGTHLEAKGFDREQVKDKLASMKTGQ